MDQLVSLLQSVLGLNPRQGWTWVIAGTAVLGLHYFGVGPFASLDTGWVAVAGIAAVFGAAILIVSLGAYFVNKAASRSETRRAIKDTQQQWDFLNQEALRNVEILSQSEQAALAWIVRNGQKRFRTEFFQHMDGNLVAKRIVLGPVGNTNDVYEVIDSIWAMRDQLKERYEQIQLNVEPPWSPYGQVGRYLPR
ncbi:MULTISPECIES: hypothetical protein [unclassified Mesorhizobium]|uniref:hypothetical protein n=1 Tax=unclassified Mesorhizobium TaxID=325217 RepID=UPI000F7561F2|nr:MULTISPECIES: hypothetical protein [unclassified Mesorhizobium]TGT59538.1 hypothetical protein EN813_028485 [Mesorhizobium sp. M00.F.Ca.ET.170.01.1.1]AZO12531.1 hypothetical protein EJ074_27960 [Mesorhizobium sp. M3A.F.Ca.ET.080.04.2.1]RWB68430.1 MAG: hypothetical protein EOQ49_23055 [Mesorhizobium sp.]RWB91016.1 MAG: hypothetical protein EOQ52_06140 [Mesorhizobium sp.]RWE23524.1 MAG: hypothetical protein EOS41_20360 [Mesorhizobium sp.]